MLYKLWALPTIDQGLITHSLRETEIRKKTFQLEIYPNIGCKLTIGFKGYQMGFGSVERLFSM